MLDIEQAWANRSKTIRAAVRLRYSIMADNELKEVLPEERKKFDTQVKTGMLPEQLSIRKILNA